MIVKGRKTNSNIGCGTRSQEERFARTGNRAPDVEPTRITNTEAILIRKDVSAPPPEPQSMTSVILDMSRMKGG